MTETPSGSSTQSSAVATVASVMRPPLTTAELNDHLAAAAYLMKHASTTSLVVMDARTDQPIGIITETDISHAVADGRDMNKVRIGEIMTHSPTVISATTSVRDAAELMTAHNFRHLPVVDDSGLVGMVDISAVCRALLDEPTAPAKPGA